MGGDLDDASTATGPLHRATAPASRGTSRPATRTAQAPPGAAPPSPVARDAKKESLQALAKELAAIDLKDPKTWPTDPPRLHTRVFLRRDSKIRLKYVDKATLRQTRTGAVADPFQILPAWVMSDDKAEQFLARFVVPLLQHDVGRRQLASVITGRHPVMVVWATGAQRFGLTGTIATDQRQAGKGGRGSMSVIFMDEHGADWKAVPDLDQMPDIGFFHELHHAEMNQRAGNDGMTEREARIKENQYRHARGASEQRKLP